MSVEFSGHKMVNFSSFLVPENEKVVLTFEHEGDLQKFIIKFEVEPKSSNGSNKKRSQIRFSGEQDQLNITFVNFDSATGISSGSKMISVGTDDAGRAIKIMAYVIKSGSLYKLDIQTMLGGDDE